VNTYILVVISLLSVIVYSFTTGIMYERDNLHKAAITHNCGQYNPDSGLFEWLPVNEGTRP